MLEAARLAGAEKFLFTSSACVYPMYKQKTTDVTPLKEGIELAEKMSQLGVKVLVFDSLAMEYARDALRDKVQFAELIDECLEKSDIIVITIPSKEFADINIRQTRGKIIDAWRLLRQQSQDSQHYSGIGLSTADRAIEEKLKSLWG